MTICTEKSARAEYERLVSACRYYLQKLAAKDAVLDSRPKEPEIPQVISSQEDYEHYYREVVRYQNETKDYSVAYNSSLRELTNAKMALQGIMPRNQLVQVDGYILKAVVSKNWPSEFEIIVREVSDES